VATVRWTVGAVEDLQEIVEFIGRDSLTYASSTAHRIITASERLQQHPESGRVVPEYDEPTIRELIVGNYRLVYRVTPDEIAVLAIVHGSRDLLRRLAGESWDLG
jgi:addiction module RelE/StbE family toxin